MTQAPFAIVNLRDGARRDVTPFLLQNDSFPVIENSYLFRGRIQKRSSYSTIGTGNGRLRWQIGVTAASPFVFALPDIPITSTIAQFSIGAVFFTDPGGASPVALLSTDPLYTGTLDRATGVVTLTHPVIAATAVFYYPGLPVMGLKVKEQVAINDELLVGFDTRYSYLFDVATDDFIAANTFRVTGNVFTWESTNSDFFWTTNYIHVFWATNNIAGFHAAVGADAPGEGDGIRWFDGPGAGLGWSNFNPGLNGTTTPPVVATSFLLGGLIILPYKDRLVVLNTIEGANLGAATRFAQRARWSQNGTPFYVNSPVGVGVDLNAWSDVQVGKGGFVDAPTAEVIVSAEFIKDTLIVYFERSTWQLVYTGNEVLPFVWQKINTELGSESTFSVVPFDRGVFAVGNYGIVTTDSVNVVRLDQKIPDEVFQIQNINDGVKRVYGIRDYNAQLVYWTYPIRSDEDNDDVSYTLTYPNQVLFYNYLDGSWAETDDTFTCFGYWQKFNDTTWAQLIKPWSTMNISWNSQVLEARYPDVIAGNQRGFVFVFSQLFDLGQNAPSLEISNFVGNTVTIPDHNLVNGQYILITGATGFTGANNQIFKIAAATVSTFTLVPTVNAVGYTGGGLITTIPNLDVLTKEFNPFYQNGDSVRLNYIDVLADRTETGQFTINVYINSNTSVVTDSQVILTSTESAIPIYAGQTRIWHRFYTNTIGSFYQLQITLSDTQIRNLQIATSNIRIHALVMYVSSAGRLSYDF